MRTKFIHPLPSPLLASLQFTTVQLSLPRPTFMRPDPFGPVKQTQHSGFSNPVMITARSDDSKINRASFYQCICGTPDDERKQHTFQVGKFARDNMRKRERLTQQHIYNRCQVTTAPNTTGKSSMTSIAHRGGWGPTRTPNTRKTTQSRLPEKSTNAARQMHSQKYQVTRKEPLQRQPQRAARQAQGAMGDIGIGLVHMSGTTVVISQS